MTFVFKIVQNVKTALKGMTETNIDPFPIENLPEELLIVVLSLVKTADLRNCCLVCRRWLNLINSHALWKTKCILDKKVIPPIVLDDIPVHYYRTIYLKNPYGRNLVRNPSGKERMSYWLILENGGDCWKVENPPQGAEPIPNSDSQFCFATSYGTCKKSQVVNLLAEGIDSYILDKIRPDIEISEWHSSRFDCGTTYTLTVILKNAGNDVLDAFKFGPYEEAQWTGREWSQVKHVFSNYPPGVRYIAYTHSGRDTQFWAGHFGSKMACSSVKILFRENNASS